MHPVTLIKNLAKHLPLEVCYILLDLGDHAGAVCGRF